MSADPKDPESSTAELSDPEEILRLIEEQESRTRPQSAPALVEPRTATERQLKEIWLAVLRIDAVGIHDDFFELGGHSLLLTQLAARVQAEFGVELPLGVLFSQRTIVGMATAVEELELASVDPAELAAMVGEVQD